MQTIAIGRREFSTSGAVWTLLVMSFVLSTHFKYDIELALSVYQRRVKKFLSKLDNFYVFHNRTRIFFSVPEVVRLAMHLNK